MRDQPLIPMGLANILGEGFSGDEQRSLQQASAFWKKHVIVLALLFIGQFVYVYTHVQVYVQTAAISMSVPDYTPHWLTTLVTDHYIQQVGTKN